MEGAGLRVKVPEPKVSKPKTTSSTEQDGRMGMGPTMQKQLLIIGDSISGNIDIDIIEKAVKGRVRATKAYAATFDNVGTQAKAPAKFPKKNFTDVIPAEVKKEPVDYLLLQSGSVDITNLNTKDNPKEKSEYFKKEVRYAAKNLFDPAEKAFSVQPSLKKVVIMTQTPRYDLKAEDPLSLKPVLADIFNHTLPSCGLIPSLRTKLL